MYLVPIVFIKIQTPNGNNQTVFLKTLLNSGASASLATKKSVQHFSTSKEKLTLFKTASGNFSTNGKCQMKFKNLEFKPTVEFTYHLHVIRELGQYDFILDRNFLQNVGIKLTSLTVPCECRIPK